MKRKFVLSLICMCSILSLIGCGKTDNVNTGDYPVEEETNMDEYDDISSESDDDKTSNNDVLTSNSASQLLKTSYLVDSMYDDANVMYSPLSFNLALGMIANGMTDSCKSDISSYLGQDISEYNDFALNYITSLPDTLAIADGIFVDNDRVLNTDTKSLLEKYYQAGVQSLNFDNPKSVDIVNQWCADNTNNRITSIVDDLSMYSSVLLNVLYFNDSWAVPIDEYAIMEDASFTKFDGTTDVCTMMSSVEDVYLENDKATGFIKYYSTDGYGFVAILPKETGDFNVSDLDLDGLLDSKSYGSQVYTVIPEFTFDTSLSLKNSLSSLGLSDIFGLDAVTSLYNGQTSSIDEILQKTSVTVNREGTEAAAITGVMVKDTALPANEPKYVTLDRPFVFMIYDFNNDIPLFIGKVVNMSK